MQTDQVTQGALMMILEILSGYDCDRQNLTGMSAGSLIFLKISSLHKFINNYVTGYNIGVVHACLSSNNGVVTPILTSTV